MAVGEYISFLDFQVYSRIYRNISASGVPPGGVSRKVLPRGRLEASAGSLCATNTEPLINALVDTSLSPRPLILWNNRLKLYQIFSGVFGVRCATSPREPSTTTVVCEPSICQVRGKQLPFPANFSWNEPSRVPCRCVRGCGWVHSFLVDK